MGTRAWCALVCEILLDVTVASISSSSCAPCLIQLAAITASLAIALPMSIAVFPQEACFRTDSLETELQSLRVKGGEFKGQKVTYLYANKGL